MLINSNNIFAFLFQFQFHFVFNFITLTPVSWSFVSTNTTPLTTVLQFSLLRWSPVSKHQCSAGGEKVQWPSLYCLPLANWSMGTMHRGLFHSINQHICGPYSWRWCLLFCGDANPQSHLCPGECGPGSSQKVRKPNQHILAYDRILYCTSCEVERAWNCPSSLPVQKLNKNIYPYKIILGLFHLLSYFYVLTVCSVTCDNIVCTHQCNWIVWTDILNKYAFLIYLQMKWIDESG